MHMPLKERSMVMKWLHGSETEQMMMGQSSSSSPAHAKEPSLSSRLLQSHPLADGSSWWRRRPKEKTVRGTLPIFPQRPHAILVEYHEVDLHGACSSHRHSRDDLLQITGLDAAEVRTLLLGADTGLAPIMPIEHWRRTDSLPHNSTSVLKTGNSAILRCRGSLLLLRLGDLRAVIDERCVRLFSLKSRPSRNQQSFLDLLQARLQMPTQVRPEEFPTSVVECALLAISQRLDATAAEAREALAPLVNAPLQLREMDLERVRQHRSQLQECDAQAASISSALMQVMNESDSQHLGLGGTLPPTADPEASRDFEAMVEAYLHAYSQCSSECRELLVGIEDFEASTALALQARRLHIEEFELMLVIGSVAIGAGALIPSLFGMNLLNNFESSNLTFRLTVVATILVSGTLFLGLRFLAMYKGVFSSHTHLWTQQIFDRSLATKPSTEMESSFTDPESGAQELQAYKALE
mmetsp:Transcript_29944/g.69650  ORF Transcript_29944/g.69650 Transcript_29944/m.69650 type:complete len:467 (-) Transcript_29944:75-1475(-)